MAVARLKEAVSKMAHSTELLTAISVHNPDICETCASAAMSEKLPDWAAVPSSKGWYVHTIAEDSQASDHAADGKAGLLIGRNNQVRQCPWPLIY